MRVLLVWNRHHNLPDRLGCVLHALPRCQPQSESRSRFRGRPQFRKGSVRRCRGGYFGLSLRPTCSNHSRHRHAWRFYRTDGPDNATGQRRPAKQYSLILWIASIGCPLSPRDWGALGFLSSFPAIRLREDYLGMLLLGSAQLFQIFLGGTRDLVGGSAGIQVPDVFKWAEALGVRDIAVFGVFSVFAVLVYVYLERTARSPLGRTLRAVRDNEVASRALGKDDVAIRRNVIIVASAISAMAGALLTFYAGSVGSETWTRYEWTFWIWVMVI